MKGCFVSKNGIKIDYVFGGGRKAQLSSELDMLDEIISRANMDTFKEKLQDIDVIFATWDMEDFTQAEVRDYFPNLKAVFYAAGSVRYFAGPFLESGVKVISAWGAMAIPVAEFTVSQIVQANKGYYLAMSLFREKGYADANALATRAFPGTYHTKVGILGAGMIGKLVIHMLKSYSVDIFVYDPFMSEEQAISLGVKKSSLEEIFSECQTISNHIANNPQTVGMLDYKLFTLMKNNAAFINTGRGAQVVEADLARALREKPERCAILDVTYPEPCPPEHEFWQLPNLFLTPHIAGLAAAEVWRMADYMMAEFRRFKQGQRLEYEVTLSMLSTMA
ncbi:hydroxyacid dehydrogenase [Paenibacillus thalictri]|uniref:Hydroxyacid dehydrogenase n=1 Tax=Paenibacillus thalictri TaxID=2527873 RepID=A0A4Q9DWQ5_9BACL|nr:hydroxyacid dehydrogenase [Paenibacillus thalictri]TBL81524.1 hydroxyacid dehydrogenase [Paenibacillus thalictri]